VNLATQVGRTFDLFDWIGVNPTGAFVISSPYVWDLSNLYTTGRVTLTAIPEPSSRLLFTFVIAAISAVRRKVKSGLTMAICSMTPCLRELCWVGGNINSSLG
jgi:hypothetical protein